MTTEKNEKSLLVELPLTDLEKLFQESVDKDQSQAEKVLAEIAQRAILQNNPNDAMNFLVQSITNYHLSFFSHSENGRSQLKISFPPPNNNHS